MAGFGGKNFNSSKRKKSYEISNKIWYEELEKSKEKKR